MSNVLVKSLRVGRCLELGVLNSRRAARRGLVFWDNRVLQLEEMEVGKFIVSCRFKNCEDGFLLVFLRSLWAHSESRERRILE